MPYSAKLLTVFSCLALTLAAAACGGDDSASSKPAVQPTPVAGAANVAPGGPAVTNNTANFDAVSLSLGAANFGQVTSARDPRTMQFGLKIEF